MILRLRAGLEGFTWSRGAPCIFEIPYLVEDLDRLPRCGGRALALEGGWLRADHAAFGCQAECLGGYNLRVRLKSLQVSGTRSDLSELLHFRPETVARLTPTMMRGCPRTKLATRAMSMCFTGSPVARMAFLQTVQAKARFTEQNRRYS